MRTAKLYFDNVYLKIHSQESIIVVFLIYFEAFAVPANPYKGKAN
jgi:hypothetical protein